MIDKRRSNLPIGALVFCLVFLSFRFKVKKNQMRDMPAMEKLKTFDFAGIVLLLGAVSCLFLALQWGGNKFSWSSTRIICLLVGFGLLLIAFGLLQWRLKERATIPLRILRGRTVLFGSLALFSINMSSNIVRLTLLLLIVPVQLLTERLETLLSSILFPGSSRRIRLTKWC